jgi:LemA protein
METIMYMIIPLAGLGVFHSLESRKHNLTDVYRELRGNLGRRYDLIPEMIAITKKYLPTEGALLEKIITVRLGSAEKLDTESSHCVQHEIYKILFNLINLIEQGQGKGAKDITRFHQHVHQVEKNIKGSENFYLMTVTDYNKFLSLPVISTVARLLKFEAFEVFKVHQVEVEKTEKISEELWGELEEMSQFA